MEIDIKARIAELVANGMRISEAGAQTHREIEAEATRRTVEWRKTQPDND